MIRSCLILGLMGLSKVALAADIGDDIRKGSQSVTHDDGGYFEASVHAGCIYSARITDLTDNDNTDCDYGLGIGGEYRYKGLFFEGSSNTSDGLNLGYTLWSNTNWSVDLLAASVSGHLDLSDKQTDPEDLDLTESERNESNIDRDTFYAGAGTRITYFFGENIFQFRLVTDIHDGNGIQATARLGRAWQVRNWNLHGIASLTYSSADLNQYQIGINDREKTQWFPAYRPGSSIEASFEAGATYPINEHWVSRTTLRYFPHSSTVRNSPLFDGNWSGSISTTLSYVF
ncbi:MULTISPECIES: MipA/OmpV family protein [unclassified Microbulbifer]|uniref:MipA/OmpV family protein n=1 Tax=unclassified Microbulbifer TaxID=2619833 RepID=UPI0027E4ECCE|nr:MULTISPECIES: MipA/OmpV family protein [unclassified Microbulbifer]